MSDKSIVWNGVMYPSLESAVSHNPAAAVKTMAEQQQRIEELERDRAERIKNHNEIFNAWQKDKAKLDALPVEEIRVYLAYWHGDEEYEVPVHREDDLLRMILTALEGEE